jgi:hypothetical protein
MISVKAIPGDVISLGRRGENMARSVVFDIREWRSAFGDGMAQLLHQRPGDKNPYPCAVDQNGDEVRWSVTSADVAVVGYGRAELQFVSNGAIVKSEVWPTNIDDAMGVAGAVPPAPQQNWVERVLEASADALENAKKSEKSAESSYLSQVSALGSAKSAKEAQAAIEGMTVTSETLDVGSNAKVTKSVQNGVVNLHFGIPASKDGRDGTDGENGYTPIRGVDYWTEEDKQEILDEVSSEQTETEKRLDKLEEQMADLLYEAISITSFSHNAGTKEMGDTVKSVALNWAINKTPDTLTLDGETLDVTLTSKALSGLSITKDNGKTWTLKATDERGAVSTNTTSISFQNGIYYGAAAMPDTVNSAFVMALANKLLSGTKNRTVTIAGGDGLYAWYAYPKRLGTSLFNIGGFDYEYEVETVSFTNSFGYTEDYYVYRSGQYAPASLSVTVKNGG